MRRTERPQSDGEPFRDVLGTQDRPTSLHAENETDRTRRGIFLPRADVIIERLTIGKLPQMSRGHHRTIVGELSATRRERRLAGLIKREGLVRAVQPRQQSADDRADAAAPQLGPRDSVLTGKGPLKMLFELPNFGDWQHQVGVVIARVPSHVEMGVENPRLQSLRSEEPRTKSVCF